MKDFIDGYRLICGLEIHVELKTESKMFCGCKNDPFFAEKPNIYTCDYCLGRQTQVPVPNKKAIEYTIKFGLFVDGEIEQNSYFERKHYVYPDSPKGWQTSQCTKHFIKSGTIGTSFGDVHLLEAHLEEDMAKLIHKEVAGKKMTLIDFNRSGLPLVEIVSQPEIHSAEQASEYAKNIQSIVRYLGIADADMEKGQMRFDANISLQTEEECKNDQLPSYKVEVKNINTFKGLEQAIKFEIDRQKELLDAGKQVPQETRGFDLETGVTTFQREKGTLVDFNPTICPDMSKIEIGDELLAQWQNELPDKISDVIVRWEKDFQIEPRFGEAFVKDRETYVWANDLFTKAQSEKLDVNKLASRLINKKIDVEVGVDITKVIVEFKKMDEVADLDVSAVNVIIDEVLSSDIKAVEKYKAGQKQVIGVFVGQTRKKIEKKADANQVRDLVEKQLDN
ncbi:MAG: Asp-tRNA(Asn)/Glu-tRNA(Gln) amidotransferase subunit GatB [Pseudomonadales bacterium]|jgi:aspartyl-tRNA(Asn)/glutamyl-tRNA(Gln) amidotransferase subunit B|nr:Asp-tRNA(Asn)/Glu-tRNA(Gln) amidotransferase subunit GatB [Pseudomonadales bacterium]